TATSVSCICVMRCAIRTGASSGMPLGQGGYTSWVRTRRGHAWVKAHNGAVIAHGSAIGWGQVVIPGQPLAARATSLTCAAKYDPMTSAPILLNQPNAAAVRAQVERMTASSVFRNSPQLATFLWFIVEAQLRGQGERLKGYTIG